MAKLTEEMIIARSKLSDLSQIKKLNCWGADLNDVSIIKRLRGVEVLALSVNRISTLEAFENLPNLQELYLRKNNITDLNELAYLQNLPKLKALWLEENPCVDTAGPNYRRIVLRTLPKLVKLDNVEVSDEEVNDALKMEMKKEETYDSREYIYEEEYNQQPANNNNYTRESPNRETLIESNLGARFDDPTNDQMREEYQITQSSPAFNNHQEQRQMHSQEKIYDDSYPRTPTYRDTPSRQQRENSSIPPSMSTQSMREFHHEEGRNQHPANSHLSQNDLREMQDSSFGQSRTNLSQQPRYDERREIYANRNTSASREDFGEDISEQRRSEMRRGDGKVPWQFSDYMRRPTNRTSNLLSAVLCLVKELDQNSLEVVEHAVRCRIDEIADSL